jgi:iron complex transport system permease protein
MLVTPQAKRAAVGGLALLAVAAFAAAVRIGPMSLSWDILGRALFGLTEGIGPAERAVIFNIRLPRAFAAAAVGATLAACGAAMQGLFRNPLADPGLIGVSSGASLGSVLYLKFGAGALAGAAGVVGGFALPVCAFAGGLVLTCVMYRSAEHEGRTVVALMLLAGIALNAMAGAAIGLVLFFSDDDQLRQFTFWTLGNVGHASWPKLLAAAPFLLVSLVVVFRHVRPLNSLLLGEAEAGHLGVDLQRVKLTLIFATAAGVGAGVSVTGGIGFIGLVAPHMARQALGADHRWLVPGAALLGAALLLIADMAARTLAAPAELPVGVITALLGAPVLFSLLRARKASALASS